MKKKILLSAVSIAAILCLYPARGFCGKDADIEKAKELFLEATEYYNEGQYAQAVIKFHDTYDLSPQPELLFNIAVCYEELDQDGSAMEYYRKYLEENPDAKDKKAIEKKIARLESGEEGEEEEEEGESGTKKLIGKIKKLVMPEDEGDMPPMRASWMHGIRIVLAGHLGNEVRLRYKSPAWSISAGYDIRFKQGKASLAFKVGYGQLFDNNAKEVKYHLIPITGAFGWEVWQYKARLIQLLFGGLIEFDINLGKRRGLVNEVFIGAGPVLDFIWNVSQKLGIKIGFATFAGYATYNPHWGVGFNLNLGIVWGIK